MLNDDIRFLGTSGSKKANRGSSSLQVADDIVIDAGNLIHGLRDSVKYIDHIFLTHSHLDHISDIAFLIDTYLEDREIPLKIYGLKETIDSLKEHIFNWNIWPDFQEIELLQTSTKSIEFIQIDLNQEYNFKDVTLKPIEMNHTIPTCGYVIKKKKQSFLYATDTYINDVIWRELNSDTKIKSLIIDVSFPSDMQSLANKSKHLTPTLLKDELKKLKRDDLSIYVTHIKPHYQERVEKELNVLRVLKNGGRVVRDGEYLRRKNSPLSKSEYITNIATALSKEKDLSKILDMILSSTMRSLECEGGTIYLIKEDKLIYKSMINYKLNIHSLDLEFPTIDLYPNGEKNRENISAVVALNKEVINIPNIYLYHLGGFNFSGTKKFDKENGYKTISMLVIPMLDHENEVIGVMQLINKNSPKDIVEFSDDDIKIATTFANLGASAITKNQLIDDLEELIVSFLKSIAYTMSIKSPYGHGHIKRVKELMSFIIKEIDKDDTIFKDKRYSKDDFHALELAAWMHDIGKISTPDQILDKATRLEKLIDRIELIRVRFEFIKQHLKASYLDKKYEFLVESKTDKLSKYRDKYEQSIKELDSYFDFILYANKASTILSDDDINKIINIGKKSYIVEKEKVYLLTDDEIEHLTIKRGTLTQSERQKVNEHAKVTYDILNLITFPKKYKDVPKIASGHHEKLNGKGYPLGLSADEISFETRVLAIVDILEALTATDRPYKLAKNEDETFAILDEMVKRGELDGKIVSFIKKADIYNKYIQKEKREELVD